MFTANNMDMANSTTNENTWIDSHQINREELRRKHREQNKWTKSIFGPVFFYFHFAPNVVIIYWLNNFDLAVSILRRRIFELNPVYLIERSKQPKKMHLKCISIGCTNQLFTNDKFEDELRI